MNRSTVSQSTNVSPLLPRMRPPLSNRTFARFWLSSRLKTLDLLAVSSNLNGIYIFRDFFQVSFSMSSSVSLVWFLDLIVIVFNNTEFPSPKRHPYLPPGTLPTFRHPLSLYFLVYNHFLPPHLPSGYPSIQIGRVSSTSDRNLPISTLYKTTHFPPFYQLSPRPPSSLFTLHSTMCNGTITKRRALLPTPKVVIHFQLLK